VDTVFDKETAVEHLGGGRYAASASERWGAYVGPNGGYLAAVFLNAFADMVHDPARRVRSISLQYLEPPAFGAFEVHVNVERAGRSMTSLSGRLVQGGRAKALAIAAFSGDRASPSFHDAVMPVVPPPPTGAVRGDARLEITQVLGSVPQSGGPADFGAWIRLDEPRPLDPLLAAVYVDGWFPAMSLRVAHPVAAPTVDLTIHFRQHLPPAGIPPESRYFLRLTSRVAQDGFVEEDAELWSPDGTLLVQSRQLEVVLRA